MAATPTSNISFQNFFSATLSSDITASAVDIPMDNIPNGSEGFLVIDPDSTTAREVIYYNSKTVTKVVCPSAADGRGQDDTSAGPHLQGTTVIMAPVAAYYEALLSLFTTSPQGWTSLAGTVSAVTYNGNRSYDISISSDNTAILSPGMRLRSTRTVTAPTQCTSLNGTTQYYSKSSPAGMTFTDDFVVSAWVKLSSYAQGAIEGRYNGTSGWRFNVEADGRIVLIGYNSGSSNYSYVISYQSLPLNKWVHVAAQLDMSAFTATPTTSYIMIDGVDVPASVVRAGTNPTALVQAGDLQVGATNSTLFFPGKIAQAFVSSAKITQANVRTLTGQGLTSALISANNIVSAYSFNGVVTDLNTSNANDLSANGSAVATNADSPFGGQAGGTISSTLDYAIIAKVTASTITVNVAEGCTIPTSGGISAVSYSTQRTPFGFPGQKYKWRVASHFKTIVNNAGPLTVGTWYYLGGRKVEAPLGDWDLGYIATPYYYRAGTNAEFKGTLSTSTSTEVDAELTICESGEGASGNVNARITTGRVKGIALTAATPYYLICTSITNSVNDGGWSDSYAQAVIYADNAYL